MTTQIGICSHPFLLSEDGRRDLVLRQEGAPKHISVPLYDHHDLSESPIGLVHLEFTPICRVRGENLCFVAGQVLTEHGLPPNQSLSISAPLLESIGEYDILGEPIEVSTVDKAVVPHCRIYAVDELMTAITTLYTTAPLLVERLNRDLA
jgi:hypothetical protein